MVKSPILLCCCMVCLTTQKGSGEPVQGHVSKQIEKPLMVLKNGGVSSTCLFHPQLPTSQDNSNDIIY